MRFGMNIRHIDRRFVERFRKRWSVNSKSGALYEAFEPAEAKRIRDRFEFVYTPKHGSWLNMAEIELNVLMNQCLDRKISDMNTIKKEVAAWQKHRNNKECKINWQFTNQDARVKLKKLYPTILD